MTIQVWSWWRITIQGSTRYPMSIQIEYNGHAYCFGGRLLARSVGLSNITLVTEHIAFLLMTSSHGSGTCIISCLWFLTMVVWGCICIYIYIWCKQSMLALYCIYYMWNISVACTICVWYVIQDTNTAKPPESNDSSIWFAKYYMQVARKLWILT